MMSIALNTACTMDGPTTESDADFDQEASNDVRTYKHPHKPAQPPKEADYLLEVGTEPEKIRQPSNIPDMGTKVDGPTATQLQPSDPGFGNSDTGFILPGPASDSHGIGPGGDTAPILSQPIFNSHDVEPIPAEGTVITQLPWLPSERGPEQVTGRDVSPESSAEMPGFEGESESTHRTCPCADHRCSHIHEEFDKLNVSDCREQSRFHSEFENIEFIGKGGYGKVFKCTHRDCAYAVKRIQLMDPKNVKNGKREVEILSKLEHRNIVAYHHCWIERHPAGWLKDKDKDYFSGSSQSGSFTDSSSQQSDNGTFIGVTQRARQATESSSTSDVHVCTFCNEASSEESGPGATFQVDTSYGSKNESSLSVNRISKRSSQASSDDEGQTAEQFLYIQMELCKCGVCWIECEDDKHSLRGRLLGEDRGALRVGETFVQLVDALEYIHSSNVIHQDLKPNNIFFACDGKQEVVKIGDFGLARYTVDETGRLVDRFSPELGTCFYISPEMASKSGDYTDKTDIFSLGVVFFEMFYPLGTAHERGTVLENIRSGVLQNEACFPEDFHEKLENDQIELIRSMLEKDASKRPSAKDIQNGRLYDRF